MLTNSLGDLVRVGDGVVSGCTSNVHRLSALVDFSFVIPSPLREDILLV